jgi:diguanylate cyclase (GGDEF)-like protein/PAS domain S-box-containing protein
VDDSVLLARELLEARRALALTQSVALVAAFTIDVETDTCEMTPELRALWGLPESAPTLPFEEFLRYIHPEDRKRVADSRRAALASKQPYHIEYRVRRRDGELRHVRADGQFFYDADGKAVRNIGAILDVTDQTNARRTIEHLMGHDKLTGLLDRDRFMTRVQEAGTNGHRGVPFVVVVFDLDKFTGINDAYGSIGGDTMLRTLGRRLAELAKQDEYVARISGNEFAALLRLDDGSADEALARLQGAFAKPVQIGDALVEVTATFGTSLFPVDATDESLVVKASLAMSQLKNRGAHGVARYHPEMERMLAERRHLQMSLHGALERNEFELYYQPIVDAKSLEPRGAEALLRWNHPSLGVVPPGAFLPAAEDAGLIQEIDAWVLRRAIREGSALAAAHGTRVGFNITAHSLLSQSFATTLKEALAERPLPPGTLVAEITEQALLADHAQALASLTLLREAGIRIALDDFGTGYNTLSYLRMFPIDIIKIDRSFIADLERYAYSRSVCSGILALASQLGLQVVAEGVETVGQEEFLREAGCQMLQGYRYGRPVRRNEFEALVERPEEQRAVQHG